MPQVITIHSSPTRPGEAFEWHSHRFDELALISGETWLGVEGKKIKTGGETLFLHRRGESHGFWNGPGQRARFWVLHFSPAAPGFLKAFLNQSRPRQRIWKLDEAQAAAFKSLFLRILSEHFSGRAHQAEAEAALIQLLLVEIKRWSSGAEAKGSNLRLDRAPFRELWDQINDYQGPSSSLVAFLKKNNPNYDSLRQQFSQAFGCTPKQMLLNLRLQQAKKLLLDTAYSIKEISQRLGFPRQHEFARSFHAGTGFSPTQFRNNPLGRRPDTPFRFEK